MRTLKLTLAFILTFGLVSTGAVMAQADSDSAEANALAEIITAISIAQVNDLEFGQVVASASAGTVVVTPAGVSSATGGATLGSGTSVQAAQFTVTGEGTNTYAITLPGSIQIASGVNEMAVDTFTSDPSGTGALIAGSQTLNVGATLNVGVSQVSGAYTGPFTVTVSYN